MKVPRGYNAYKQKRLAEIRKRMLFEKRTEWKTRLYIV